jgi:hypothetical protein
LLAGDFLHHVVVDSARWRPYAGETVMPPNHALQRTRHDAVVGNRCVPCAGSLSLGR